MTNTYNFAKRELDILVKSATDPEDRPIIEPFIPQILAICQKFGKSGQSGGSAPYTATALSQAIKKLCLQEPICPITGIDEEWNDVGHYSENDDMVYQNKRCYALFKDGKGAMAHYLDAIVWKSQHNMTFTGTVKTKNGEEITSRQYIKGFPFTPKTFYIDVISTEVNKNDWEYEIKDETQLKTVFKYYRKK
jgi:hypothetical protein